MNEYIWSQKYRPKNIEDCILPAKTKKYFQEQIAQGQLQNMLFTGSHGTGKTTAARAIADELGADILFLNLSKDSGVDVLRTKMVQFSSTVSMSDSPKIILGDEFDHFSPQGQAGMRGLIEEVSSNCRFILTANFPNKIIDPILSRMSIVDFKISSKEMKLDLAKQFLRRCISILDEAKIKYDANVVGKFVAKHFPDFRKTLDELQRASIGGEITEETLYSSVSNIEPFIKSIKDKDFKSARKYIAELSMSPDDFITELYGRIFELFQGEKFAKAIIILNDYSYKGNFVANPGLNLSAMTAELFLL